MSRTTLCLTTAAVLAIGSLAVMTTRYAVLGREVKAPAGPNTWKVRLVVQGNSQDDARLITATPLDFGHQHVVREECVSKELTQRPADARHPERRQIHWTPRSGAAGPFRARCEFYCSLDLRRPTSPMSELHDTLYAPPKRGSHLDLPSRDGADAERISALARELTAGMDRPADVAETLYRYVAEVIGNEPSLYGAVIDPVECLDNGEGDSGAKSRLLAALLRNRGIPARILTGVTLNRSPEHVAHHWVEAYLHDRWLPMCPFHRHYGYVPRTYLVFAFGDLPVVRGRHISDLKYAFLVEKLPAEPEAVADASVLRRTFLALSLYMLPPSEQHLVEFLLLLPVAALVVCLCRNVIGLGSFGTFAPALVGLAFRDLHSLPGLFVFVSILLVGWLLRRALDWYHLLQVPRVAVLLSLIVIVLVAAVVAANYKHWPATRYIPLFPMVILTGMIERFWTLEVEDTTAASFKTLLSTLLIALTIAFVTGLHAVSSQMFHYPETLGLVMAGQLLIGRYTGYRLSELFRFRDYLAHQPQNA